jgi:hypothetical protein
MALAVGTVDLDDAHRLAQEQPRQSRAIGAGALDTDELELAEAAQPGKQPPVARRDRRERLDAEEAAGVVERGGDVHIQMRVDPGGDPQWQDGHRHPFVLASQLRLRALSLFAATR